MSPLLKTLWNSENNVNKFKFYSKVNFNQNVFVSNELKFWMTAHAIWVTRWLSMATSAENSENFVESPPNHRAYQMSKLCQWASDAPEFFQLKSCPNMSLVQGMNKAIYLLSEFALLMLSVVLREKSILQFQHNLSRNFKIIT